MKIRICEMLQKSEEEIRKEVTEKSWQLLEKLDMSYSELYDLYTEGAMIFLRENSAFQEYDIDTDAFLDFDENDEVDKEFEKKAREVEYEDINEYIEATYEFHEE